MEDRGKLVFEGLSGKRGALPAKKDAGKAKAPALTAEQKETVDALDGNRTISAKLTGPDGGSAELPASFTMAKTALGKGLVGTMTATSPMGPMESALTEDLGFTFASDGALT